MVTADGGTGYLHQVTVSRSRSLAGPYERDPHGPLLTARDHPELPLQKAGHGSLVHTGSGQWYLAYLAARPVGTHGPCVLGRETALAPVTWTDDGWPRVETGLPQLFVPAPDTAPVWEASASVATGDRTSPEGTSPQETGPQETSAEEMSRKEAWTTSRTPNSPRTGRRCVVPRPPTGSR
ncbi:family 43 glycosylhydrolase [Streptomyces sp. NBC_01615]|uniref:family 43 glycosylhydrolase n=1 Tax=Streptomyces sp. NBC_01615 TaxID=2975898 RepID=UPI0038668458